MLAGHAYAVFEEVSLQGVRSFLRPGVCFAVAVERQKPFPHPAYRARVGNTVHERVLPFCGALSTVCRSLRHAVFTCAVAPFE